MGIKEQKDLNPLVLKFGVALALTFAGFAYSRIRTQPRRPLHPPPSRPSGLNKKVGSEGRSDCDDDANATPTKPNCRELNSTSPEAHEKAFLRIRADNSSANSSTVNFSEDSDELLLPEFESMARDFSTGNLSLSISKGYGEAAMWNDGRPKVPKHVERIYYEKEIQKLRSMVRSLRERERSLEMELLEHYGLKEQETTVMELQSRVRINNVEAKLLSLKIESLQADNKMLQSQLADYSKVVAELNAAKAKIKLLRSKLRFEAEHNREQILNLKQRVARMQLQDQHMREADASSTNTIETDIELQRRKLQDLEIKMEYLKKSNYELQIENLELARKVEGTHIPATEDPEVEELKNEAEHLKDEHKRLMKEVEKLEADRSANAEELVYLRWVIACLRHELTNHQPASDITGRRDLSRSLSPKSEREAKKIVLEYENNEDKAASTASILDFDYDRWSSSQSHYTDSGEAAEEASVVLEQPSLRKTSKMRKMKFFGKLKNLLTGKHPHLQSKPSAMTKPQSVEECPNNFTHDLAHNSIPEIGEDDRTSPGSPRDSSKSTSSVEMKASSSSSFSVEEMKNIDDSLNKSWIPSQNSTGSSLELIGPREEVDVVKDVETVHRSSSGIGSSSDSYRRLDDDLIRGKESAGSSPLESQPDRHSETS